MRVKLTLFAALLLVLALGGCKKTGSVVGTWKIQGQDATATFDPAGTFSIAASKGGMDTTINGSYTLTDKELTMVNNEIKVSTKISDLSKLVPVVQKRVEAGKGKTSTELISFKGEDSFALFDPGDTSLKGDHAIFDRQK